MSLLEKTTTKIDHATFTISFHRTFRAPREAIFEAWTKPEEVAQWWDPENVPLKRCVIDLRVGGSFVFENASSHGPAFGGTYREISPPSRLVFDAMGAIGTVELTETAEGSAMGVTIKCPSREHFDQFLKLGVDKGTARTLDNLVELIHKRRA